MKSIDSFNIRFEIVQVEFFVLRRKGNLGSGVKEWRERKYVEREREREWSFYFQWRFAEISSFFLTSIQFFKVIRIFSNASEVIFLFFGKVKFRTCFGNFSFSSFWKSETFNALEVIFPFSFFWKIETFNTLEVIFLFFGKEKFSTFFESNFSFSFFWKIETFNALELIFFFFFLEKKNFQLFLKVIFILFFFLKREISNLL